MQNNICRLMGVKNVRSLDIRYNTKPVHGEAFDSNTEDIKNNIKSLLYEQHYDSVLLNYNNTLYVCQSTGDDNYVKRLVTYHPLQSNVGIN